MRFTDTFVGYSGSVHDTHVFANSPLLKKSQHAAIFPEQSTRNMSNVDVIVNVVILGDSAYPLVPWLLKPFPESATMPAERRNYNYRHSSTFMVVERTFGMLRGRLRCLSKCLDDNLQNAITTIMSCCTLHNYCLVHGDHIDEVWLHHLRDYLSLSRC